MKSIWIQWKKELKENTLQTKVAIIEKKILPYFKDKKLCEITPTDVISWQNEMMKQTTKTDKEFSPTYLKTLHNQLSAIFNYAVRYYGLSSNPLELPAIWERKQMVKCSFGPKRNT